MGGGWRRAPPPITLRDLLQVDHKNQRLVRPDRRRLSGRSVGQLRGDRELAPPAFLHADEALVTAGEPLAGAERQLERLVPPTGRVELRARAERDAHVLEGHLVPVLGRLALAL